MAYASTALRKIQISSPEAVVGTAQAATEVIVGATYDIGIHDRTFFMPEQDRGSLDLHYGDMMVVQRMLEGSLDMAANHRQMVWPFCSAIAGNITPTQPDAINEPNTYQWLFNPAMTVGNTPDLANGIDTFTIEWGDNAQAKEAAYLVTTSLELSGTAGEEVRATWEFIADQVSDSTFTPALTAPTGIQYFATNAAKFYIDSSWATLGTTQKLCMLREFTWTLETQFMARFAANGTLTYCGINEAAKSVELSLSYYVDTTNFDAAETQYETQGTSFIRIELLGDTELDSGESNPPAIYLDQAVQYIEVGAPSDEDGVQVVEMTAQSIYDTTSAENFEVTVLTDLAAFA